MGTRCAYCKALKRPDQLMPTRSGKDICVECSEKTNMCMTCGSTTEENFSPAGQLHFEPTCE